MTWEAAEQRDCSQTEAYAWTKAGRVGAQQLCTVQGIYTGERHGHISRGETTTEKECTRGKPQETSEYTRLGEETAVDLLVCSKGKIEGLTNTLDLIRLKILC